MGCDGKPGTVGVFDACGVCQGDNSTCTDCAGVVNGGAVVGMSHVLYTFSLYLEIMMKLKMRPKQIKLLILRIVLFKGITGECRVWFSSRCTILIYHLLTGTI